MTDVTKYQLCLDYFKLVLKVKKSVSETNYLRIIDEAISKIQNKNVSEKDMILLKNFFINLNDSNFYDDCMEIYLSLKKYDTEDKKIFPNLEFLKIQLYNYFLDIERDCARSKED